MSRVVAPVIVTMLATLLCLSGLEELYEKSDAGERIERIAREWKEDVGELKTQTTTVKLGTLGRFAKLSGTAA